MLAHRVGLLPTSQPSSASSSSASSAQAPADAGSQEESPTSSRLRHNRAAKSSTKPAAKGKAKKGGKAKAPAPVGDDRDRKRNINSGTESEEPCALSSSEDEPEIVAAKSKHKPTKKQRGQKKARRGELDDPTGPIDPKAGRGKTEFAQFQNIFHKKVKGSLPPGASIGEAAALVGAWWRFVNDKVGDGIDPATLGQRFQPQHQQQYPELPAGLQRWCGPDGQSEGFPLPP